MSPSSIQSPYCLVTLGTPLSAHNQIHQQHRSLICLHLVVDLVMNRFSSWLFDLLAFLVLAILLFLLLSLDS